MTTKLLSLIGQYSNDLANIIKYNPELLGKVEELELVINIRLEQLVCEAEKLMKENSIQITDLSYLDGLMNNKVSKNIN
jgi:hypothetical protein